MTSDGGHEDNMSMHATENKRAAYDHCVVELQVICDLSGL
jgi:hypothetical protein